MNWKFIWEDPHRRGDGREWTLYFAAKRGHIGKVEDVIENLSDTIRADPNRVCCSVLTILQ